MNYCELEVLIPRVSTSPSEHRLSHVDSLGALEALDESDRGLSGLRCVLTFDFEGDTNGTLIKMSHLTHMTVRDYRFENLRQLPLWYVVSEINHVSHNIIPTAGSDPS